MGDDDKAQFSSRFGDIFVRAAAPAGSGVARPEPERQPLSYARGVITQLMKIMNGDDLGEDDDDGAGDDLERQRH